jgi:hypothetical protein
MPGLGWCYVGSDRDAGAIVNVSLSDTLDHAQAIDEPPEMRAQRPVLQAAGVVFEPITDHPVQWLIDRD